MLAELQQVVSRQPPPGGCSAGTESATSAVEAAGLLSEARLVVRMFRIFGNIERTMILFLIAERNGTTVNDIVGVINLSKAYAYQHVNRLMADGWIKSIRRGPAKAYVCSNLDVHLLLRGLRAEVIRQREGV